MNELVSAADIDRLSLELLRASKSLDVFPTPVDRIVEYADLVVRTDIDLSKIHVSYRDRANAFLKSAKEKVRGLFDIKKRTIYLDLSQSDSRKSFVKLHETAHGILPWQRKVHDIIGDNDITLSPDQNEEFEAEANYFASATIFQHDRFTRELSRLGLGIDAAMQLSKHFGASIHAALRRYVDCSKNRCALLILNKPETAGGSIQCQLRNLIMSKKFEKEFGIVTVPSTLDITWAFVQDYAYKRRFKKDGRVKLATEEGETEFSYQFFNNHYNAFVFLHPVGEVKKTRTTIIVKGVE